MQDHTWKQAFDVERSPLEPGGVPVTHNDLVHHRDNTKATSCAKHQSWHFERWKAGLAEVLEHDMAGRPVQEQARIGTGGRTSEAKEERESKEIGVRKSGEIGAREMIQPHRQQEEKEQRKREKTLNRDPQKHEKEPPTATLTATSPGHPPFRHCNIDFPKRLVMRLVIRPILYTVIF